MHQEYCETSILVDSCKTWVACCGRCYELKDKYDSSFGRTRFVLRSPRANCRGPFFFPFSRGYHLSLESTMKWTVTLDWMYFVSAHTIIPYKHTPRRGKFFLLRSLCPIPGQTEQDNS